MFYAYVHCRPDGSVFYVGKGDEKRISYVRRHHNPHHCSVVEKHGIKNILVGALECSDEATALALEVGLIKRLSSMGVRLTNMTSGGETPKFSDEVRAKIAAAKIGNDWNRGRILPREVRLKQSRSQGGTPVILFRGDEEVRFEMIVDAARFVGVDPANIHTYLKIVPKTKRRRPGLKGGWHVRRA